jgi:hypothetical protein
MDRLTRTFAGCGLMFLLVTSGCHSGGNKVPPGRSFSGDGRQTPPIDFNSDPHPMNNMTNPALGVQQPTMPGQAGGQAGQFGTPTGGSRFSVPTSTGAYGPPGTAGTTSPYLGGSGTGTNGTAFMPPAGGVSDPTTTPPLGSQPGSGLPTGGSAGLSPGAGASSGNSLP